MIHLYIGWDPREAAAYAVCSATARSWGTTVSVRMLHLQRLLETGITRRRLSVREPGQTYIQDGEPRIWLDRPLMWDAASRAPCSTEFANTRFLVPKLAQHGWAIFCDCDTVWLGDPGELMKYADPRYAVMCVKHPELKGGGMKMDGQAQVPYPRKNWSSVMLWNCEHPANRRLTDHMLDAYPGRDLHRFCWLEDHQIGALPPEWNWLVGVQPMPANPKLAHFTLGGPWIEGWEAKEHDRIWLSAYETLGT